MFRMRPYLKKRITCLPLLILCIRGTVHLSRRLYRQQIGISVEGEKEQEHHKETTKASRAEMLGFGLKRVNTVLYD